MSYCKICGEWDCDEHKASIGRKIEWKKEFSGSSPPDVFVGRWNYPNVYSGILAPRKYGDTENLSSSERWHKEKLSIDEIMRLRSELIYARAQGHIKNQSRFLNVVREVAMTHKSIATEFKLKKPIMAFRENDNFVPIMTKTASVEQASLEENAPVKTKIDYLVNDESVKSTIAMQELYRSGISVQHIMKLLSAGLLGRKTARKLVPTRWSITAVDDSISKEKLERVKLHQIISDVRIFTSEYLGNHYEFILLPESYSFEVIEAGTDNKLVWQDYEGFFPRKKYAESVTGAYYANRFALVEYLERIKRQASCLVLREVRPEYNVPLGVGILRETSREAFSKEPEIFENIDDAFKVIQTRMKLSIEFFREKSWLLKNYGKQRRLAEFF